MAESQVQLKREEIIGGEVVLNDIDPKTTTESVTDLTSGLLLDESLMRIWNAINNKLSRVVNSVNGRTGVLVLSPEDVGLGKVDNVSFAEIQKWVIEQLKNEFDSRTFKLYNSLDDLDVDIDLNDKSISGSGFFAKSGRISNNDKLSYIGYITLDEGADHLTARYMPISIIGYTDHSILYNEKAGDRDFSLGGLGVNIAANEDSLVISEELSDDPEEPKKKSGLKIIKEKIAPNTRYYKGPYGNPDDAGGEDSWLYLGTEIIDPSEGIKVEIFYNNRRLAPNGTLYSRISDVKLKDIFICDFTNEYLKNVGPDKLHADFIIPEGIEKDLIDLHTAIGTVTNVTLRSDNDRRIKSYTVSFRPIVPKVGYGLTYTGIHHLTDTYDDEGRKLMPMELTELVIKPINGAIAKFGEYQTIMSMISNYNVSGLSVRPGYKERMRENYDNPAELLRQHKIQVLPSGPEEIIGFENGSREGGLGIFPDCSLCVVPTSAFCELMEGDRTLAKNWRPSAEWYITKQTDKTAEINRNCLLGGDSLLSVNLFKASKKVQGSANMYTFANLSGLKILNASDSVNWNELNVESDDSRINPALSNFRASGGLMINCGPFLEITPSPIYDHYENYYDGGKLTIKIGKGIHDDGEGNLTVGACEGIGYNENGDLRVNLKPDGGLQLDTWVTNVEEGARETGLSIELSIIGGLTFNPGANPIDSERGLAVNAGDGLCLDASENKVKVKVHSVNNKTGSTHPLQFGLTCVPDTTIEEGDESSQYGGDILALYVDEDSLGFDNTGKLYVKDSSIEFVQGSVREKPKTITIGRGLKLSPT